MSTALIIEFAIKFGIPAARELVKLLTVENPTIEQWEKVFAPAEKSYDDYIAAAKAKLTPV